MALSFTLESIDGLDDSTKALYTEVDGKFVLDVDPATIPKDSQNSIPKHRLDQEIEKRKASDASLKEIAEGIVESVPEEHRDMIPDLPPAKKIKWIQQANAKGLFSGTGKPPVDSKKPGDKAPVDFKGLSPHAIMAQGYGKHK